MCADRFSQIDRDGHAEALLDICQRRKSSSANCLTDSVGVVKSRLNNVGCKLQQFGEAEICVIYCWR